MSGALPVPLTLSLSVPSTASTTTAGPPASLNWPISGAVLLATVTGMSASTLDLYVQESWDGGSHWDDVAHLTQVAGGAAAATYRISLTTAGTGSVTVTGTGTTAAPGVALAANKVLDGPWGPLVRLVAVTGSGSNSGAVTQTVSLYTWRPAQSS